jgi:hypothetical protein
MGFSHQYFAAGGDEPVTLLGILLILFTCLVAVGIGYVANENVRRFDEREHVDFLGREDGKEGDGGEEGLRQGETTG